jgi:serine phosphatase RsbU (regulator of sigma subunit)/TPR repeat protein
MSLLKRIFFLLFFCLFITAINAQATFTNKVLQQADTAKERFIKEELHRLFVSDTSYAIQEIKTAATKLPKNLTAHLYTCAAIEELKLKSYSRAIHFQRLAYNVYKELQKKDKQIELITAISRAFMAKEETDSAMNVVLSELAMVQHDARYEAALLNRAGVLFKEMKSDEKAMDYLLKADEKFKETDSLYGHFLISKIDNDKNLGVLYRNKKSYDTALFYLNRSLVEAERIHNDHWISVDLNSLGILYRDIKNYPKAIECFERSVKLKAGADNTMGVATSLGNLGNIYEKINNPEKAEEYYKKAYELGVGNDIRIVLESAANLYRFYDSQGRQQKAYPYLKQAFEAKDSVFRFNIAAESAKLEAIYENQKKSKEIEIGNFKNEELNKNLELKNRNQKILIIGALLLLAFSGWALWSYIGKRKANKELNQKNEEVHQQKLLVEHHNKEILDSINYAQKIQQAILPKEVELKALFKDAFVLFKPKNIVSGDFYWLSEKGSYVFYATADCTGHGVPGGFMSMLASSLLNEIVNEGNIHEPSEILNLLRQRIIQALKQKGEVGENKDGMDMTICRINKRENELVAAGANNQVWIINNSELEIIKANKFPVGISSGELLPFTQKTISLVPGSVVYTFTDGYPDQFGGAKGKKFMYKQFQELLTKLHHLPCSEQLSMLESNFNDWKGELEQVDDVCIIGIRI